MVNNVRNLSRYIDINEPLERDRELRDRELAETRFDVLLLRLRNQMYTCLRDLPAVCGDLCSLMYCSYQRRSHPSEKRVIDDADTCFIVILFLSAKSHANRLNLLKI